MQSTHSLMLVVSIVALAACGGGDASDAPQPSPDGGVQQEDAATEGGEDAAPDTEQDAEMPDAGGQDAPDGDKDAGCAESVPCAALAAEQDASDQLASILGDEGALNEFLTKMPKGGDLHMHLSGAVYAETYLDWAKVEGGYCITTSSLSLSWSCSASSTPVPSPGDALFEQLVRAWSMKDFVATAQESGHDHFFATFGKFGAISGNHHGKMLADALVRAANENEVYIEPMLTSNSTAQDLGADLWSTNHAGDWLDAVDLPAFRDELMAAGSWPSAVQSLRNGIENAEAEARQILGCDGASPSAGCSVGARYATYISRSGHTAGVFAQMLAAFEAAKQEPRLVALNLVGPEDSSTALKRYDDGMGMLGYLYEVYTATGESPLRVTLHAGELAPKYTPSTYDIGTIEHIRKAVQIAHAQRIGHGLDVLLESDSEGLLEELDQKNVLVEICLSSNVQILEVRGADHPLATYLREGVPVALATDDQAVSRSSIAGEHRRAVQDQQLNYMTLKGMARNSLEHAFLQGDSLWKSLDDVMPVDACANSATSYLGQDPPPVACQQVLANSARAAHQWELERRFRAFEAEP